MEEEEIDLDEHWSYTIMGNWRALDYFSELFSFCTRTKTSEERKKIRGDHVKIRDLMKIFIGRCYEQLINFVKEQNSRLGYLVLGVFLMQFGGKMIREIRDEILKFSNWEYERDQFNIEEEKELRKRYLSEFREKISNYVVGVHTLVSEETPDDVFKKGRPQLTSIDYSM